MWHLPIESGLYVSLAYTEKLTLGGIAPSSGSVGDAYDNALMETTSGLYKTERTHASIWDLTPIEIEQISYAPQHALELVG